MAVVGTSTAASLFLAHHAHHNLLETNVKEESEQEPLYRAPKAAAVPLATAATVVVASASRIHISQPCGLLQSTVSHLPLLLV